MSRAIVVFLLAAHAAAFGQARVGLNYEPGAIVPNQRSLLDLNHARSALYACDSITVQVFMTGELRAAKNPVELMEAREKKLRQLFKEELLRPAYLSFEIRDGVDKAGGYAAVIVASHPFELKEEREFVPDTVVINDAGWRVKCKLPVAHYAKQIIVQQHTVYDYLLEHATHAALTTGGQIDIAAMYTITVPDSLAYFHTVQVLIPMDDKLSSDALLCVPFRGRFRPLLARKSKAKTRISDKQVFLTVPVKETTTVAVAQVARSKEPITFVAPPGYVITLAEYRSEQPDNYTCAFIGQNEVMATFGITSEAAYAVFRFEMETLNGVRVSSDWLTLNDLKKSYKCKRIKLENGAYAMLLTDRLFVQPTHLAHHE